MRSKILAPLAVAAVALTVSSTSSAQQAPSAPPPQGASASASFSTSSGFSGSSSGPAGESDAKKTVLPIVVGGLGAAQLITGVVLLVAAPSMPSNCEEGTRTCTRKPGQSEASFQQDQQDAGDSQQMNAWGLITVASGGAFLVAGAAMWFWYHRDGGAKTASSKPLVMPYATTNGGGLAAVATF